MGYTWAYPRGLHREYRDIIDNGKENGNYYMEYWDFVGIMEKKMETTIGNIGIMLG